MHDVREARMRLPARAADTVGVAGALALVTGETRRMVLAFLVNGDAELTGISLGDSAAALEGRAGGQCLQPAFQVGLVVQCLLLPFPC